MDPRTGAILALANWPQVNANDPGAAPADALQNRAVGFDYEPGSTFKAVTVSGALQQGLITPDTPLQHPRPDPGRRPHDPRRHRTRRKKPSRTSQILAHSSNVGAIKIGKLEGAERFNGWVHRFGFGAPTGVDLPGEETGVTLPLTTTRAPRWATCRSARASS